MQSILDVVDAVPFSPRKHAGAPQPFVGVVNELRATTHRLASFGPLGRRATLLLLLLLRGSILLAALVFAPLIGAIAPSVDATRLCTLPTYLFHGSAVPVYIPIVIYNRAGMQKYGHF